MRFRRIVVIFFAVVNTIVIIIGNIIIAHSFIGEKSVIGALISLLFTYTFMFFSGLFNAWLYNKLFSNNIVPLLHIVIHLVISIIAICILVNKNGFSFNNFFEEEYTLSFSLATIICMTLSSFLGRKLYLYILSKNNEDAR